MLFREALYQLTYTLNLLMCFHCRVAQQTHENTDNEPVDGQRLPVRLDRMGWSSLGTVQLDSEAEDKAEKTRHGI